MKHRLAIVGVTFGLLGSGVAWAAEKTLTLNVENMTCGRAEYAIELLGNRNLPIENLHIINCSFENVEKDMVVEFVNGLYLTNVTINGVQAAYENHR